MEGINTSALLVLFINFLYAFAFFEFFKVGRPVCMSIGTCSVVFMVSFDAKFLFDIICKHAKYLRFTVHCLSLHKVASFWEVK